MNDMDSTMGQYERRRQALAKLAESNKGAVFDALAAAGITEVVVDFDGEGDSGQINGIVALRGTDHTTLPVSFITPHLIAWGETNPAPADQPLEQAIETLCYDYLEQTHDGWENNDGACGEFRFDVAGRTIELEFNGRFTDTWTDTHTF
jgi:uncharacterized protein DUF6878